MPKILRSIFRKDPTIRAVNGDSYIIECEKKFYMITPDLNICTIAKPPELPDCFLKFGYWEEVEEVNVAKSIRDEINYIFKKYQESGNK